MTMRIKQPRYKNEDEGRLLTYEKRRALEC